MRTVNFYRTESGNCPVEDFLDSLSGKQAQKVVWVLRLIEELEIVPVQYLKKLVNTDDIFPEWTEIFFKFCHPARD